MIQPLKHFFMIVALAGLGACERAPVDVDGKMPSEAGSDLAAGADSHRAITSIQIKSVRQGWTATGLSLAPGDQVTLSASGAIDLGLTHPVEPRHVLWGRIGDTGPIFQLPTNEHSFSSSAAGELNIAMSPSGLLWANQQGEWLDAVQQIPDTPLDIAVKSILWTQSASEGLQRMQGNSNPALAAMASRALSAIESRKQLPAGFQHLWYLGQSNIFAGFDDGAHKGVHARTSDDFGIIKKTLDIPLTQDTRISFDWLYGAVPALASETSAASHDYLSIAVEFDNGKDITWMWSKDLAPETIFACPLPEWQQRETHIVLQSGSQGIGEWFSHTRPVQQDYQSAVKGDLPTRIVGLWIIGVAVFGLQQADAHFANIVIEDGVRRVNVF
jgi:hypothetical protein